MDLKKLVDEIVAGKHDDIIEKVLAESDARREEALKLWPSGKIECRECEVNCQGFHLPEPDGPNVCGLWGLPFTEDMTGWMDDLAEYKKAHPTNGHE